MVATFNDKISINFKFSNDVTYYDVKVWKNWEIIRNTDIIKIHKIYRSIFAWQSIVAA